MDFKMVQNHNPCFVLLIIFVTSVCRSGWTQTSWLPRWSQWLRRTYQAWLLRNSPAIRSTATTAFQLLRPAFPPGGVISSVLGC